MRKLTHAIAVAIFLLELGCAKTDPTTDAPARPPLGEAGDAAKPLKHLDLLIDWQAEPTYIGIYYAKTLGYFAKAGFDVKVIQSWGANEATLSVAAGKYKLGTASGGATVIARSQGADVVSMAVLYHRLPTAVYGLAKSGIRTPKDLEGRSIGVYPKSITRNEFEAFAKLNGVNMDRVRLETINGADIPLILSGRVDGVLNYFELSPTILALEQKTFSLLLAEHGVEAYGLNIITSRKALAEEPLVIREITDAILSGYRAGCDNPEAAVQAFLAEFPEKDKKYVETSWSLVCRFLGGDYGSQTPEGWRQTVELYRRTGVISKPVSPEELMP